MNWKVRYVERSGHGLSEDTNPAFNLEGLRNLCQKSQPLGFELKLGHPKERDRGLTTCNFQFTDENALLVELDTLHDFNICKLQGLQVDLFVQKSAA